MAETGWKTDKPGLYIETLKSLQQEYGLQDDIGETPWQRP